MGRVLLLLGACALTATCSTTPPPSPLDGFWAPGEASCAAGIGVVFAGDAVRLALPERIEVALDHTRYAVRADGDALRIELRFAAAGGEPGSQASGRAQLRLDPDARISLVSSHFADVRTGAVRLPLDGGHKALGFLEDLRRCDDGPHTGAMRGRADL